MAKLNDAIRQYIEDLHSPDYDTRMHAELPLIRIGTPAVDALMDATRSENPDARWRAAYALGKIGDHRAYPALLDLVVNYDDPISETRKEAILALGSLGDLRAIDFLAEIILTPQPGDRGYEWACLALGEIGEPAIEVLIGILDTGHFYAKVDSLDILEGIAEWGSDISGQTIRDNLRRRLSDPDICDEITLSLSRIENTMDAYERIIAKIFENCGFSYDPGVAPKSSEDYAEVVVGVPYGMFKGKVVPGHWPRSVARHLHDIRRACDEIIAFLRRITHTLDLEGPEVSWHLEDLAVGLELNVGDEFRSHVFWFLTPSETIRNTILTENKIVSLVPAPASRQFRSRCSMRHLAARLSQPGRLTEAEALQVAKRLVHLELQCRRTRGVIEELVSEPDATAMEIFQRFTNVQAAILDTAQMLLRADLVPKCLWFDRVQWTELGRTILSC